MGDEAEAMNWRQVVFTALGAFGGSLFGAYVGQRLAMGCPVWPW